MSKQPFEKFINTKPTGAKKKEIIRQDKKKVKAETRALAEEFRRKNAEKYQVVTKHTKALAPKPEEAVKTPGTRFKKPDDRIKPGAKNFKPAGDNRKTFNETRSLDKTVNKEAPAEKPAAKKERLSRRKNPCSAINKVNRLHKRMSK